MFVSKTGTSLSMSMMSILLPVPIKLLKMWPMFAGGYLMKARKRVYTLTPVRPRWRLRSSKVVGGLIEPTTRGSG